MNTRISYLYRDAANYKAAESVVLAGELADAAIASLRAALARAAGGAGIEPVAFSPIDLGLPPAQEQLWATVERNEDDHIYNELLSIERTSDAVTCHEQSAAGLLAAVERVARDGYDVARAMDVLGIDG